MIHIDDIHEKETSKFTCFCETWDSLEKWEKMIYVGVKIRKGKDEKMQWFYRAPSSKTHQNHQNILMHEII